MLKTFMQKKAKFQMHTFDFIYAAICCKCFYSKKKLRDSVSDRKILNYRLGAEKINKELDVGVILKKLRQFSHFMKVMLTKNQMNLLKLRSSKFLPSSDDMEQQGLKSESYTKIIDEKALLSNYVDLLIEDHDDRDIDLLNQVGLRRVAKILKS